MGGWQGRIPLYLAALGRILAQFSPAAPRFRLRRATLPLEPRTCARAAQLGAVETVARHKAVMRCARLYLCIRAAVAAAGRGRTGYGGCTEGEVGAAANSGTD